MARSFIPASRTASMLVICQLVSLMSLLAWGAIASMILRSQNSLEVAGSLYAYYPAFPVALGLASWVLYRSGRHRSAIVLSVVPAIVALGLMTYYFVIGAMNRAA